MTEKEEYSCEVCGRKISKEKIGKRWIEIPFDIAHTRALYAVKAMLHSVIAKDGFDDEWLNRVNESLKFLNIENLRASNLDQSGILLEFEISPGITSNYSRMIKDWVAPIFDERNDKLKLLSIRFKKNLIRTEESFKRLERFRDYLAKSQGRVKWENYFKLRRKSKELYLMKKLLSEQSNKEDRFNKLQKLLLDIERKELKEVFRGETFQFQFQD